MSAVSPYWPNLMGDLDLKAQTAKTAIGQMTTDHNGGTGVKAAPRSQPLIGQSQEVKFGSRREKKKKE